MTSAVIDVAIVGAGPVGTLLAAELARLGVAATVIEQRAEAGGGSRAVGIHATALAAMEASGATDRLLADALRVRVGEARRRGRTLGEVRFDRLHARHPFVATLPQSATEAALAGAAAVWGAPPPRRGAAVTSVRSRGGADGGAAGAVEVTLDAGESLAARIVVVAGGLRSRALLPALGGETRVRRTPYPDRYLMTDTAGVSGDGNRAVVHLDPRGVLESFPLPGGRRRYVAWVGAATGDRALERAGDSAEADAATARLRTAVAERTGSDAEASTVSHATTFGVARSRLTALRVGRVLAIGDAAHEVSPIGGQGMNLGLIDAVTLAPLLARWIRYGDAPPELAAWERARLRAADLSGRLAAANTTLGRPHGAATALGVRLALAGPTARLMAHAYAMGFDSAARRFRR